MESYSQNPMYRNEQVMGNDNCRKFWGKHLSGAEKRKRKKAALRAQGIINDLQGGSGAVEGEGATNGVKRFIPYSNFQSQASAPEKQSDGIAVDESQVIKKARFQQKKCGENEEKVAIVCQNFPDESIKSEQLEQVRDALAALIDALPADGFMPKLHTAFFEGAVITYCHDRETLSWVTSSVADLKPWEGASLKTVSVDDLPTRVILWVPGCNVDNTVVLRRIQKQNTGLHTSNWKINGRLEIDMGRQGVEFDLSVDKDSFSAIKAGWWKLYCGAVKATVYEPSQKPHRG